MLPRILELEFGMLPRIRYSMVFINLNTKVLRDLLNIVLRNIEDLQSTTGTRPRTLKVELKSYVQIDYIGKCSGKYTVRIETPVFEFEQKEISLYSLA